MEAYLLRRAVYELGYDRQAPARIASGFPSRDSWNWYNPLNPHEQIRSAVVDVNPRACLELH